MNMEPTAAFYRVIYPPNRPLERIMQRSQKPVLYENLFFIDVNNNGDVILGCSNVAGTYWEGTLFNYRNIAALKENAYNGYYISNSTTSDAKFLKDSNKVLLAEDIGTLKLLNIPNEDTKQEIIYQTCFDKGGRVEQISVWDNSLKAVTCSENSVSLYDLSNGASIKLSKKYDHYHTETVTSVDSNKSESALFTSTSVDKRACVWDDRIEVPASVLYANEFSALTSVAWNTVRPNNIAVGSEAGDVYLLDIRQPKDFVDVTHCFERSIHRISFSECGILAVCGDLTNVLMCSCENNKLQKFYENTKHSGIVRGLAWYKKELYSCGFNKVVLTHVI